MSDTEDTSAPDGATAQKLVKEFESVTNTDEIMAQYYLQEHDWDLSRALNTFFASKCEKAEADQAAKSSSSAQAVSAPGQSVQSAISSGLLTTQAPSSLVMVSWNIDGLDQHNLKRRTKAVVKTLQNEAVDIVFLQEVIPETFSYLKSNLPDYECLAAKQDNYFVATLLRRGRVYLDKYKVVDFPTSRMYRHLLAVQAHCGSVQMDLLNTHLESTKDHAEERMKQLEQCLGLVSRRPPSSTVIFGGDLNMRDKELASIGGLPEGVKDAWEEMGSKKEVQYTWDLQRNSNLEWPGKWKPRCRFDRVYVRQSEASSARAVKFGLVGLQKVEGTQSFPSDHWGVRVGLGLQQEENPKKRKLEDHREELFDEPAVKSKPFQSSGNVLGSFTTTTPSSFAPAQTEKAAQEKLQLDESQPVANIQVRLTDGSRLIVKLNHTHCVADLRLSINTARPQYQGVQYSLLTTFPSKEMTDDTVTIASAGLVGAAVMQRIK